MRVHVTRLASGISRTREFERKQLASYAVNIGTKCGHGCLYCSTGALLRMHPSFKVAGESPFASGYAIVDPDTPRRVARDARRKHQRGLVQLCTTVDAWSPEAQEHNLGRRCLEAILSEPGWTVRILTKNAAVIRDFEFISQYRERVLVALSITATPQKAPVMAMVEPNASPIPDRLAAVKQAHEMGLRTYAMFCPLLPGVADSAQDIAELVQFAHRCHAEEVFVEPVNPRGPGLCRTAEALAQTGYAEEALAVSAIRNRANWSCYVATLLRRVQQAMSDEAMIDKLRFLLYPSRLTPDHGRQIRAADEGVVWLGKAQVP